MEDIFKFCVLLTFGKSGTPVNTVMQINPPFHDSKWSVYFQLLNSRPTSCYMITWAWNVTGGAPSTTLYIASIYFNSLKFQLCSASKCSPRCRTHHGECRRRNKKSRDCVNVVPLHTWPVQLDMLPHLGTFPLKRCAYMAWIMCITGKRNRGFI